MATPPWDTKAPKENVVAWHEGGWVHGDVLDIGCGLGDNAIYLARQGFNVTGLDISPTALITADRRAKDAGVNVTFAVTDSTKLEGYTDAFDTVVDSGMFHCLDDDAKRSYAAAAHRATRPGATLLLSCFSDANPSDEEWPRPAVSEDTAGCPRRRGLEHRIVGARFLAARGRRLAGRDGVLVRQGAAALASRTGRHQPSNSVSVSPITTRGLSSRCVGVASQRPRKSVTSANPTSFKYAVRSIANGPQPSKHDLPQISGKGISMSVATRAPS